MGLLYWVLSNPLLLLMLIVGGAWLLEGQVRGRLFNPWRWLDELRQIRALKQLLDQNPHDLVAHADCGRLLISRKRYAQALPHLEQATSGRRPNADATWWLAQAELALGRIEAGREHLEAAWALKGEEAWAEGPHLALGDALSKAGQIEAAAEAYERAAAANSSSSEARFKLGGALRALERKEEAARAFADAIACGRNAPSYKRRQNRIWRWRAQLARIKG